MIADSISRIRDVEIRRDAARSRINEGVIFQRGGSLDLAKKQYELAIDHCNKAIRLTDSIKDEKERDSVIFEIMYEKILAQNCLDAITSLLSKDANESIKQPNNE